MSPTGGGFQSASKSGAPMSGSSGCGEGTVNGGPLHSSGFNKCDGRVYAVQGGHAEAQVRSCSSSILGANGVPGVADDGAICGERAVGGGAFPVAAFPKGDGRGYGVQGCYSGAAGRSYNYSTFRPNGFPGWPCLVRIPVINVVFICSLMIMPIYSSFFLDIAVQNLEKKILKLFVFQLSLIQVKLVIFRNSILLVFAQIYI